MYFIKRFVIGTVYLYFVLFSYEADFIQILLRDNEQYISFCIKYLWIVFVYVFFSLYHC